MAEKHLTLHDADPDDFNGLRDQIVDLAGRGYSATYIAKATGQNYAKVCRILRSEFDERRSNRDQIIQDHDATLQWLKLKYTKYISESMAGKGKPDHKAAEILVRIEERIAKLYGIDQPTQVDVTVTTDDRTEDELLETLRLTSPHLFAPVVTPKPLPEHIEDGVYEPTIEPPPLEADQQP